MDNNIGDEIEFIGNTWVDTFSEIVVIFGFLIGLLHVFLLFCLQFHKFSMARLLLGHGLSIFLVSVCRLGMLLSVKFKNVWGHLLIYCCYTLKTGEIWAIGISNSCSAIMSLAYFCLIKKIWRNDLNKIYQIGKEAVVCYTFVSLFLFNIVSTVFCISYVGSFMVNSNYCLAVGTNYRNNELYSLWLALCICLPSLMAVGCFFAGAAYLALLNHRCKDGTLQLATSDGMGTALSYLNNIQAALQYSIISWLCTNTLYIFWVIYYPESNSSFTDGEYYLASAQFTTMQNVTDFTVNLHFFILPRIGYRGGIIELLKVCFSGTRSMFGRSASAENLPTTTSVATFTKVTISKGSFARDTTSRLELNESLLRTSNTYE